MVMVDTILCCNNALLTRRGCGENRMLKCVFVNNDGGLLSLFPVSFSDVALFQHCHLRPLPLSAAHAQLLFLTVEYKGEVFRVL